MKQILTWFAAVGFVCPLIPLCAADEAPPTSGFVRVVTQPGSEYADDKRLWQGIPSIERTRGGRLVVAWYSGGEAEGDTENYCLMSVSDDDNRTWSTPVLVVQGNDGVRTGEPLPWLDPQGRLWLFWNQVQPDKTQRGTWAIRCDRPDDKQLSWSEPQFVAGGIVLGKPLVTRGGEWLIPVDVRNDSPLAAKIGKNSGGVSVSTDEGKTWTWRGGWKLSDELNNFDEHCLVERSDGSIWTVLRVQGGLYQSSSSDGGRNWAEPTPFLTGATTRAFVRRLASGRLLMIYHDGPGHENGGKVSYRREMLTAYLSDDDGRSWKKKLLIDPRNQVSYPDATEGPDGRIYLTYDYARYVTNCKDVLCVAFNEADILARRPPPTPTLVNRARGYGNVQEKKNVDEDKLRDDVNRRLLKGQP